MADLLTTSDEQEAAAELTTFVRERAKTYGASVSVGPYTVKDEVRVSVHLFGKTAEDAEAIGKNPGILAARIAACAALTAKFGKKTTSNVYVSNGDNVPLIQ